ncbi:hypothetical protein BJV74DRAFT_798765 [Russula compacta]|nr:hypothetical protein BJV74DRAFT_798765 [Russula compacta]
MSPSDNDSFVADEQGSDMKDSDDSQTSIDSLLVTPSNPISHDLSYEELLDSLHYPQRLKDTQLFKDRLIQKYQVLMIKYRMLDSHLCSKKEPWVDELIFNIEPPASIDPMSTVHYTNNHQWDLAVAAELYESLPSNLQSVLKDELHRKSFINMFLCNLKQECTNIVQTAWDVATYLLSIQAAYFVTDYDHTQVPQLVKHLSDPTRPEKKYPLLASVLYTEEDKDCHQPFKCEALLGLLIGVR